ncbi:MAG: hypothetical protein QXY34_01765 [Candidatus Bathyarchaeia archaeon]
MSFKRKATHFTAILLAILLFSHIHQVSAWDPSAQDLQGTNSSSNNDVGGSNVRYDIYTDTTIYGIQVGEDSDSIAFLIKLAPATRRYFTVNSMIYGDQYEVQFTIGEKSFSLLFRATGRRRGVCSLYYKNASETSWSSSEYFTRTNIASGTTYTSSSGNIGFTLRDASSTTYGSVKLIVKKDLLYNLGARGSMVTGIFAITLAGGNGQPGGGVATPNDRCPASGYASWTLQGDIPDLPAGVLVLTIPLIAIYAYFRRSRKPFLTQPFIP